MTQIQHWQDLKQRENNFYYLDYATKLPGDFIFPTISSITIENSIMVNSSYVSSLLLNQAIQGNFSLLKAEKVQFAEYAKYKNLLITKRMIGLPIKTNL